MLKKIFTLIFKENILTTIFTLFLIFLIIFSKNNLFAVQSGLILWAENVVPSLFPFFIATELLNYTSLPYYLGKLTNKFMRPLFNVPGECSYAFIMGILSGYPVGAKITNKFFEDGICTKSEAERMLAFTNNSGPLFIIGTVGTSLFGDVSIGVLLFVTHILACLTVGLLFGLKSKYFSNNRGKTYFKDLNSTRNKITHKSTTTKRLRTGFLFKDFSQTRHSDSYGLLDLGSILSISITNAISTILSIGGFIVLFSAIISIINNLNIFNSVGNFFNILGIPSEYVKGIFMGLLELTNGLNYISNIHSKYMSIQIIISAFLLGFAGLSIFLQVFSIASKNNLSVKPYLIGKILQGIISAFYTFIILCNFNFFYFDLV